MEREQGGALCPHAAARGRRLKKREVWIWLQKGGVESQPAWWLWAPSLVSRLGGSGQMTSPDLNLSFPISKRGKDNATSPMGLLD